MKRVLLVLISDQHIPNLLSVHHYNPDYLVMVVSKEMEEKNTHNNFIKALYLGDKDFSNSKIELFIDNVADYWGIKTKIDEVFKKIPNEEWICNITGGTKIMSLATFEFFREKNKKIIYIEISKSNEIINVITGEKEYCAYKPTINEFLAGYGYKNNVSDSKLEEERKRAEEWKEIANLMALYCSDNELYLKFNDEGSNSLSYKTKRRREIAREKGISLEMGELVIKEPQLKDLIKTKLKLKEESDGSLVGTIDKYSARYLTGDWLCVFFYNLLNKHKETLNLWDLYLGINPSPFDKQANNDYDVAFIKDYQLCMIECKTGSQSQDPKLDIFYKIDSVIKSLKALNVKKFLAITSNKIFDLNSNEIKKSVKDRADALSCTIIDRLKIKRLAHNLDDISLVKEYFQWK